MMDGSFEQSPAHPAEPAELARDVSAAAARSTIVRDCIGLIEALDPALMRQKGPEVLHHVRVAIRRWRSALAVFKSLGDEGDATATAELKWLAGELDEARDLDVFAHSGMPASTRKDSPAGIAALREAMEQARDEAYDRAALALQSDRCRRLLRDAAPRAEASAGTPQGGSRPARGLVRAALQLQWKALRRRRPGFGRLSPQARHKLRIDVKKARYTTELFETLFDHPKRQRRFTRALKDLQAILGDLNDIHVGHAVAERLARMAGQPQPAFAAGLLAAAQLGRQDALLRSAEKAYDRLLKVEPFW